MDIEDIDSWYDDKKEDLTDVFNKKVIKADNKFDIKFSKINLVIPKDEAHKNKLKQQKEDLVNEKEKYHNKLKQDYLKSMDNLHKNYDSKIKNKLDSGLKFHFLKHRIKMWSKKHLNWFYELKDKKKKDKK
jgi:hypothetical protein